VLSQQLSEKFYDFNWKECEIGYAQFLSRVTKTDSGFLKQDYYIRERKLQMKGLYEDEACKIANGSFKFYHPNGNIASFGDYKHGRKEGTWLSFYINQMMSDSATYFKGKKLGTCLSWHENGFPSDSLVIDERGIGVEVSFTNKGVPSSAGRYAEGKKQEGKWVYYHANGNKSAVEIYHENFLLDKQYFDESGVLLTDSSNNDAKAEFPGGATAWQKWLSKKIYFPANVKIVNSEKIAVVVSFTINEKGEIENAFISTPFENEFNRIALNAIEKSPKWKPARMHNRTVPYNQRQVINFEQIQ
jgi:antitoxin component YwqK of YwqJK toxin-antitoxin module